MAENRLWARQKVLFWGAVATPGIIAFMANVPAKEAASNLASWIELFGLPVPDFLNVVAMDERMTGAALTFYGLLVAAGSVMILKSAEERIEAATELD